MFENGHMDHYFPQWLMRGWCNDRNEIWCFDKITHKIIKKGTASFGRVKDLNKSDVVGLDLEATVFAELDNRHGGNTAAMLLRSYYGKHKRVPNELMRYFAELCLWTSVRNKRGQDWTDIHEFRQSLQKDHIVHSWSDADLKKAIHLQFCKLCNEEVMAQEVKRLLKNFYVFFVVSDDKFITSDKPVQEYGTEAGEGWLGCEPIGGEDCTLIMFPIAPSIMFVATCHKEYSGCNRLFVVDDHLVAANYDAHILSDSEELYFPYQIYDPRQLPSVYIADHIVKKTWDVPCAIDLNQMRESEALCVVYSNWTGTAT